MTRKHFIQLAEAISTIKNNDDRVSVANKIGKVCQEANEFFDWTRWEKACKVTDNDLV